MTVREVLKRLDQHGWIVIRTRRPSPVEAFRQGGESHRLGTSSRRRSSQDSGQHLAAGSLGGRGM